MLSRLKEVVLDDLGTKIKIASHAFAQIEEFASARIEDAAHTTKEDLARAELAVKMYVVQALNNALTDAQAAEKWTVERIHQEMDQISFQKIFEASLEHDGLRKPEAQDPPAKA